MQRSQDIFKNPEFWAKFDLWTPITEDQKFSKKCSDFMPSYGKIE